VSPLDPRSPCVKAIFERCDLAYWARSESRALPLSFVLPDHNKLAHPCRSSQQGQQRVLVKTYWFRSSKEPAGDPVRA